MPKALTERLARERDEARGRDESSRWWLAQPFLFPVLQFRCFCCHNEIMHVKNWRLWIGKPDLSALSGVLPVQGRPARNRC